MPEQEEEKCSYDRCQLKRIRKVYLLALVFWVLIIIWLGIFPPSNLIEFVILLIPVAIFLISWKSSNKISKSVESYMFQTNMLVLGLLIALPILTWIYAKSKHNRSLFVKIIITGVIISILTLYDIWVPHKWLPVLKHINSVFETIALTLFIFALYKYFVERDTRDKLKKSKIPQ